ncbi:polymer-forming cytoskeletal protein, partial [Enterococcus faecalis]
ADNVIFGKEVTVAGTFHDKGKDCNDVYRKLALYSQDDNKKVTAEFETTVPKLIVSSENFNIVHGSDKGDIEVKAN